MEGIPQDNVYSFYYSFVISYFKQLARFYNLNDAKVAVKKYKDSFINKGLPNIEWIQENYFTPQFMSQVIKVNHFPRIVEEFKYEIIRHLRVDKFKGFLVGENPNDMHPKISPSNDAIFMNISEYLGVTIMVYSIEYSPCKVFSSAPNSMQISVSLEYANELYSPHYYQSDSDVDANPSKSNLLRSPYYIKGSDPRPNSDKIIIENNSRSEEDITKAIIEMSQILMMYARHIPENTRQKIIDLTSTDNRFSGLRTKLQDIVNCSHERSYYLFSCGTQHCIECLKRLQRSMNNEDIHNLKCICGVKFSSRDLNIIGIDVLTTNLNN